MTEVQLNQHFPGLSVMDFKVAMAQGRMCQYRQEEIESHGHPVQGRAMIHKSKKVYDRNRIKRAAIKSDDSSHFL